MIVILLDQKNNPKDDNFDDVLKTMKEQSNNLTKKIEDTFKEKDPKSKDSKEKEIKDLDLKFIIKITLFKFS